MKFRFEKRQKQKTKSSLGSINGIPPPHPALWASEMGAMGCRIFFLRSPAGGKRARPYHNRRLFRHRFCRHSRRQTVAGSRRPPGLSSMAAKKNKQPTPFFCDERASINLSAAFVARTTQLKFEAAYAPLSGRQKSSAGFPHQLGVNLSRRYTFRQPTRVPPSERSAPNEEGPDAFCDRGSTFPLKIFPKDGAP